MKIRLRLTKKKRRGMCLCTGGTEEGGPQTPPPSSAPHLLPPHPRVKCRTHVERRLGNARHTWRHRAGNTFPSPARSFLW